MTTLPLNAPIRLPGRSQSTTALAIPGQVGPIGVATPPASAVQLTGADVWRIIRANLWLIIIMLIISAVGGYGANIWLKKYHSRYTALGALTIVDPINYDPTRQTQNADPLYLSVNAKTHQLLLTPAQNEPLATTVLTNPDSDVRNLAWFKAFGNDEQAALKDLKSNYTVTANPDTRLLYVSMTCNDGDSAKVIAAAIADEYIKEQKTINNNREGERNNVLSQRKNNAELELKDLREKISGLEAQLNQNGLSGTMNKISQKDIELSNLVTSISELKEKAEQANFILQDLTSKINAGQDPPKVSLAVSNDPSVAMMRQNVTSLTNAIAAELASNQGPESRSIQALQSRVDAAQKDLEKAQRDASVTWRNSILEEATENVNEAEGMLKAEQSQVESLKSEMKQLTDLMQQLLDSSDQKLVLTAKLEKIDEEIDMVTNFSSHQDFAGVDWAYRPLKPESPSFPILGLTMTMSIALGLALSLGIAFLRELMDTTIRSPRDITRVGNLNLLGIIPHEDDDRQSAGARLPVVIFEAPQSMMAEQLRQVRTRLQHSSSLDTTRTILITSPSPGDGKTTIACNLASGLALNGRRILLVDANFRRPELHRIFNLANDQGFCDVLNNLEMFEHAVQETQVPNLYILPSGPKPSNATELLESQLLMDFTERALEEFDHVIFDSGPLLLVSETVALAPRVDGVLTVVRARTNSRGVLTRLRDSLKQVKAEHLGVVLNAVRSQGGGYYGRNMRTYYQYQDGGNVQ